jgi:predicted SprT family Zn-dependent metalloprotease
MPTVLPPELAKIEKMARNLMDQYGLKDWTLRFGRGRKQAGNCDYINTRITLSAPLMLLWSEEHVRDTILHEIAHALTRGHPAHGERWRRTFLSMGGNGKRLWDTEDGRTELPYKYTGTCPAGHTSGRMRQAKAAVSCGQCSHRFDRRHLITWSLNPDYGKERQSWPA